MGLPGEVSKKANERVGSCSPLSAFSSSKEFRASRCLGQAVLRTRIRFRLRCYHCRVKESLPLPSITSVLPGSVKMAHDYFGNRPPCCVWIMGRARTVHWASHIFPFLPRRVRTSWPPAASPQPGPGAHPRHPSCPTGRSTISPPPASTPTPSSPYSAASASPAPASTSPTTRYSSGPGWTDSSRASSLSATASARLSVPQMARFLVICFSWELRNCGDVTPKIQFFVSL